MEIPETRLHCVVPSTELRVSELRCKQVARVGNFSIGVAHMVARRGALRLDSEPQVGAVIQIENAKDHLQYAILV